MGNCCGKTARVASDDDEDSSKPHKVLGWQGAASGDEVRMYKTATRVRRRMAARGTARRALLAASCSPRGARLLMRGTLYVK